MIIDCVGCLHGARPQLKGGDLLIITGDLTAKDTPEEHLYFAEWLDEQPYKKKFVVAGNHDNNIDPDSIESLKGCYYLQDCGTEFEGLKIWGSPWSMYFKGINPKCTAFTKYEEDLIMDELHKMPNDIDILITHSPPYSILDEIPMKDGSLFHAGSTTIYGWLKYVVRPRLHVFSHIHEAYGQTEHFSTYNDKMMLSVNCSIMNEKYKPVNAPIRVILDD
jgi:Icc-related predicted phosphoesterase